MYPYIEAARSGKLRLVYECNPMAFIVEQAGGKATNGSRRILELKVNQLHQRTPVYIGSAKMVEHLQEFLFENFEYARYCEANAYNYFR